MGAVQRWAARLLTVVYAALLWLGVLYVIVPLLDQLAPSWRAIRHWPVFGIVLWLIPVGLFLLIGVWTCHLAARGTINAVRRALRGP